MEIGNKVGRESRTKKWSGKVKGENVKLERKRKKDSRRECRITGEIKWREKVEWGSKRTLSENVETK